MVFYAAFLKDLDLDHARASLVAATANQPLEFPFVTARTLFLAAWVDYRLVQ
jgi:hypothetical protein